jgi:hypothetical protein
MIFIEVYRRRWNADLCVRCVACVLPGLRHQKVPMEHLRGWSKKRRHVRGSVMIFLSLDLNPVSGKEFQIFDQIWIYAYLLHYIDFF